jgi:hypothetical protein
LSQGSGIEIGGRPIKIGLVNESNSKDLGSGGGGGGSHHSNSHHGDLDDNEVIGVAMNAQSRAALMAKLQRDSPPHSSSVGAAAPLPPPSATPQPVAASPSTSILLKNLFDPAT